MTTWKVALTGATGFIGSAVLKTLLETPRAGRDITVRALARTPPTGPAVPGLEWILGDLTAAESLPALVAGSDVLIHLASYIGGDEDRCTQVNVHGCAALMAEARRAGVQRIIHLSTAAVYGMGPHRGIAVNEVAPAPVSPSSRTRWEGEEKALAAGGTVLRPGLVLGRGDRWVVPAYAELLERVPARWDDGRGLLSLVDVGDLARLITALAYLTEPPRGIFHAGHPVPVSNGELLAALAAHKVLPSPGRENWSWQTCLEQLRKHPGKMSERQFSLLARDHWYRSDSIWEAAGCPAGPGALSRLGEAAEWYRAHLATPPAR
ncbi:NAD-dependent epimerase/dehydratase family protein [Streptomyces celluloflavus]|uniref:NAD-dependent epimerase/dehydratase family protein n=1 Tax=Streptomyces celluloflavus TaxID=58344 RepID=UPI00345FDE00|nr:NAD(P)-dependent oxidoreductase [Streptomyces celluloflavus]WSK17269.1 NAD(P)-dependent oxidoreductase [Streptomyces celluloflavus]